MTLVVRAAEACPYCAGTVDRGRSGYLVATALMLAVPLAMLAAFTWWLVRATRARPRT